MNLLRRDGYFSYIVANKWIRANYGTQLRDWLKKQNLTELIDFGDLPVFKGATTYPCIINIMKGKPDEEFYFSEVPDLKFTDLREAADKNKFKVNLSKLESNGWKLVNEQSSELINKINSAGIPFLEYVNGKIYYGIKTGLNKAFVINEETKIKLIAEDEKCSELIKPFLLGRDIKRYKPLYSDKYLIFTRRGIDINNYPSIKGYLMNFKSALEPKPKNFNGEKWKGRKPGSYQWYEIQDTIDYYHEFEKPKIIYPEISIKGQFTIDKDNYYSETTSYIIGNDSLYLLGILNSKVWSYLFKMISASIRGGYLRWKRQYMAGMPVPITNPKRTKQLESLVQRILDLNNSFLLLKTPQEKTALQRQIDATDRQIDQLVYELYGLTDEEIGIVEGG